MSKTKRQPTTEQSQVINSDATSIKVSANAGSGKTFTIMQRIADIIANKKSSLEQLLVLTFTDASAQDMRKKLKEQLDGVATPAQLQAASIGTFHSFCSNLVRAWFTVAEVNPSFTIMDEVESNKVRTMIFDQVVLDHYDQVARAVDLFTANNRKLDGLREVVFMISQFLNSREDHDQWLKEHALSAYNPDVDHNPAVQALLNYYRSMATKYRQYFLETGTPSPMLDSMVELCNRVISASDYSAFQKLDLSLPKAKSGELKEQSEAFVNLRKDFKSKVCDKIPDEFQFSLDQIQADIKTDRVIVEQLLQLVQFFDQAYQAKKTEYKKLDYNDLEKYALKVLANPEAVAAIRAQYKYIFVDEGQDTNPVQFKIIDILRGNDKFFCIVGDVKQSIYGFRNCEPEIFENMTNTNGNLIPIMLLGKNFRSTDPILHFVNSVMSPLIPNYTETHKFTMIGEPDWDAVKRAVTIQTVADAESQYELVYQQIIQAEKQYALSDIAVLSETGTHFAELQNYLFARGIPNVVDSDADAFDEPEIALLNHFLFAVMNTTNELPRYIVMQSLFGFTNDELAQIRLGQINHDLQIKLSAFDAVMAKYRDLGRKLSTYEVLTQVATEFGMLELPAVSAFLTAIRGLRDFDTVAHYLYLVEHNLVKIQINVGAKVQNAVRLMTIHHSKGLEFPMVILYNAGAKWSDQHRDTNQVALDKNLGLCVASVDMDNYVQKSPVLHAGIKKFQAERNIQEKIRLLYVALTRAQSRLVIIGKWKRNSYLLNPDCMLDLINPLGAQTLEDITPSSVKAVTHVQQKNQVKICPLVGHPNTLVKQSVTALATSEEQFQDYVAPTKFTGEGGKEFGTAFHRQVQYGDLPEAVAQLVAGYTVYREIPFLYVENQGIVQGIMDLLAVKGQQAIIVDYKTTRLSQAALVAKYREQLRLYAKAVPGYQIRAYLYSTVHNSLIEVSL